MMKAMLISALLVLGISAPSATAINAAVWQVDVIRCPGQGSNQFISYDNLPDASQRELLGVVVQQNNPGFNKQVRLVEIVQSDPKITYLISEWTESC